jgi:DNA-binding transcriptional regulator GbsR (MarR family)
MRTEEATFVDAMGAYLGSYGMTPMAGRLWAWLLICDPPEQSATDLAESLKASRGAISGAAATLSTWGIIRRIRRRGDRREYFSIPTGAFESLLRSAGASYNRLAEITSAGLAVMADAEPQARARLQEVHDATIFIATAFPAALDQYLRDRAPRPSVVPAVVQAPQAEEIPA